MVRGALLAVLIGLSGCRTAPLTPEPADSATCPETRPDPNAACASDGHSCQYRERAACIEALCMGAQWYLYVRACDDAGQP